MYLCAEQITNGFNFYEVTDPANCPGYIALEATAQAYPTLTDLFTVPMMSDLQTMFNTGFSLPLIAYLTAWAYGTVINWFSQPEN